MNGRTRYVLTFDNDILDPEKADLERLQRRFVEWLAREDDAPLVLFPGAHLSVFGWDGTLLGSTRPGVAPANDGARSRAAASATSS